MQDVRVAMRTSKRVLLVSPTGSGKTVIFSHITEAVQKKGMRVCVAAHRIEIVRQISKALMREGVRHGIIAPKYRPSTWPIQVAMIQSLGNRIDSLPEPDLLILDEAHHSAAAGYMNVIRRWARAWKLGVSASPCRLDGKGLCDAFDTMVMGPSMRELQDRGYLARYDFYAPPTAADFSALKKRGGDYAAEAVAAAMDTSKVHFDSERQYRKLLDGKPTIAFCATIANAEHSAEAFRAAGWKASHVWGTMDDDERERRIAAVGTGALNVLFNVDVLGEGTDLPDVFGCLDLARSASLVKFLQRHGRALRPKPDNSRAVLVDLVGNVYEHGEPNAPRDWSLDGAPKRAQASALRTCSQCYLAHAPCPKCPGCGFVYPVAAPIRVAPAKVVDTDLKKLGEDSYLVTSDLKTLVKSANTFAQLEKIAKARGYKPGWARIQWAMKEEGRNGRYHHRTGWDRHA